MKNRPALPGQEALQYRRYNNIFNTSAKAWTFSDLEWEENISSMGSWKLHGHVHLRNRVCEGERCSKNTSIQWLYFFKDIVLFYYLNAKFLKGIISVTSKLHVSNGWKKGKKYYLRGFPINRLIFPHSTLVNFLVFKVGKDSFRHIQKSLSPSNSGLLKHNCSPVLTTLSQLLSQDSKKHPSSETH